MSPIRRLDIRRASVRRRPVRWRKSKVKDKSNIPDTVPEEPGETWAEQSHCEQQNEVIQRNISKTECVCVNILGPTPVETD